MSNVQIPNLPAISPSLSGSALFEVVQAGVSSKATLAQVLTYIQANTGSGVTGISFGTTGLLPSSVTGGTITVTGTLVAASGGTGFASYAVGDILVASSTTAFSKLSIGASALPLVSNGTTLSYAALTVPGGGTGAVSFTANGVLYGGGTGAIGATAVGTTGQILVGNTGAAPSWSTHSSIAVTSISFGTTGLTPNSATTGAIVVAGTLIPANGGTGFASYAVGDLLYADTTTSLAKLADVATGNALISGGVGVTPSWGKIGLTTHVSGTLAYGNGGTGATSYTTNGVIYAGASALESTAIGTTGQIFIGNTGAAPSWANATGVAVTSISFGTTGLTPSSATQGAVTVAGTLVVSNGGTGVATLTGIPMGNGTSAFTVATAGTDYAKPNTASTWTAKQTFTGTTTVLAAKFTNILEVATISATAATGTINYDVTTQSVLYYTSNAAANWTLNIRGNGSNSLDSLMATGEAITVVFAVTQGGTPYYNNALQIDGNAVTPKYQGGTAWSAGNASAIDVYSYTIIKTGSATFVVLASQTQFK